MGVIDRLLTDNSSAARPVTARPGDPRPSRQLAVVTCMDTRIEALEALGLKTGEAHILRNAGGLITPDMLRSLAVSQLYLGTREILLMHHSDCGMEKIDEEDFHAKSVAATGIAPPFSGGAFIDAETSVRESIDRVRAALFLPHRDVVRGVILDVATGHVREVSQPPVNEAG
ncbi:MAG: beta-class carbonic anhydrase [Candidatus Dormibacteria bacterium]